MGRAEQSTSNIYLKVSINIFLPQCSAKGREPVAWCWHFFVSFGYFALLAVALSIAQAIACTFNQIQMGAKLPLQVTIASNRDPP